MMQLLERMTEVKEFLKSDKNFLRYTGFSFSLPNLHIHDGSIDVIGA